MVVVTALAQDPKQLQSQAVPLLQSKPAEALRLLQQASVLAPDLPGLHHQLGLAYHAIGDEADALPELRQAAEADPKSAAVHNTLGIVLFQLGDAKSAIGEFRTAVALAPNDASAHFNLAESLARSGDTNAGVDELRLAASLAPNDAGLSRIVRSVETAMAPKDATIKVDVRQVLVPAIVTDKQGRHIGGLKQDDFKIYEDGVEQKITSFSVESSGAPDVNAPPAAASSAPRTESKTPVPHPAVRRTYLILIDTLHSNSIDFEKARKALIGLFQQESSEDSQYVAIALGASPEMVVNVTSDVNAVLAAFRSKKMQKIFLDGQVGGLKAEMERFRTDLNDTRAACDQSQDEPLKVKCAVGMQRAIFRAPQLAELDRALTVGYLREFRGLISQLARARDRRTVILISDGFQLDPGREAEALVNAYFPYSAHCLVPADVACPQSGTQAQARLQDEFQPILQMAARANITIDTIDARGLYGLSGFSAASTGAPASVDSAAGRVEQNMDAADGNTLIEIAEATGGTAFRNSNDLLSGLRGAFSGGRDYYTLAYTSTNDAADGKFRAIAVQVSKKDAIVNAKRGYWAAAGAQ
ncbi:MAG: VWA domain-containing protein [Acidobacteriota bacterium]|nr:VWA domain-containing protein [Acidobacteriota bacterium]